MNSPPTGFEFVVNSCLWTIPMPYNLSYQINVAYIPDSSIIIYAVYFDYVDVFTNYDIL